MDSINSMGNINVNKENLLRILKGNRDKHRAIFEKAIDRYRELAIEELERSLNDAKDGRQIKRTLTLIEPFDATPHYNSAIRMLELSVDTVIPLTPRAYQYFCEDRWSWKNQFVTSNSVYADCMDVVPGGEDPAVY